MTRYVLALDQGTTSSRALLVDRDGSLCAVAQREITQHYPRPGWVEHDPEEIWQSQRDTMDEAMLRLGCAAADVAAMGITNQRETTIVWERSTGRPVYPAIVWQDRRTSDQCEALRERGVEDVLSRRTGLLLDPYFSGTKLRWILDHIDRGQARAEAGDLCFGTVDAWLVWKLTGGAVHVTDRTNASRTLMMNLSSGDWDDFALDVLRIPRAMLPRIVSSSERVATDTRGITIGGLAGDQQAALFGQRCIRPGMMKNTYGTGCFLLAHTGGEAVCSARRLLSTAVCTRAGEAPRYALEGSVFVAGAAVQWLRDGLGIIRTAPECEAMATSVPDSAGVYMVPAFAGLGAPHWDAKAAGILCGLTRGTTAAHIARAALEGIAYQNADLVTAVESDAGAKMTELRVDGGASRNDFLMQFQADVMGVPVVRPRIAESTALGAAYLAGLTVGFWRDDQELDARWQLQRRFEPRMSEDQREQLLAGWKVAVRKALTH